MKKNYLFIGLIILGFLSSVKAVDITIQVDLNNVPDFYEGGGVWLMMDNSWSEYYDMTDDDSNGIFEYTVAKDAGTEVYYKFSYQNGPDPNADYVEETVPDDCSEANGLRMIIAPEENTVLPAVAYESCYGAGVTIRVDLSEQNDLYEGGAVWVYMDDNWAEYYDMMDEGGNIYYYTIEKEEGYTLQYSFSYQTGPDPNSDYVVETVPAECANANGYREVIVPAGDLTLPAFLYGSCDEAGGVVAPTYMVTYNVDMNDLPIIDLYEGGSVWLNINDWTEYYDMTDDDGDNIYTIEMEQDSGAYIYYRFSYQTGPDPDWDYIDESVPAECASEASPGNREHLVLSDIELPNTVLGTCGVEGDPGTAKIDVTFSCELAGDSVSTNGLWMVSKNPWNWVQLESVGGDVYSSTWRLIEGQTIPYTFVYGGEDNWEGEESVPEPCNFGTLEAPERLFEGASADSVMPVIPYGECLDMGDYVTVTFQVNMSEENVNEGDAIWTVFYDGSYPEMMDEDGDDIYTLEMDYMPGTELQYYFSFGTESIWEDEVIPAECSDEEGYRAYTVPEENVVMPAYFFGTCDEDPGSVEEMFDRLFNVYPNPANNNLSIELIHDFENIEVILTDVSGKELYRNISSGSNLMNIPVGEFSEGLYIIEIKRLNRSYYSKVLINH